MLYRILLCLFGGVLLHTSSAVAGNTYKVTSNDGEKLITYEVSFGGGQLMERLTAFDPESKKFVYFEWRRDEEKPAPAMKVWDHKTGETISLYQFPEAKNPLPIIPSIEAMKVCPFTGDKKFKSKLEIVFD